MRVLVLSDRFAPDNVGGAEVSLKQHLDIISAQTDIEFVVVTVFGKQGPSKEPPVSTNHEGYRVYRCHLETAWPPGLQKAEGRSRLVRIGRQAVLLVIASIRYLAAGRLQSMGRLASIRQRVANLVTFADLVRRGKRAAMPRMDEDVIAASGIVDEISAIIEREKPDKIHLDNYLSICIGAHLKSRFPDLQTYALVRDNRFFCSQPNGAMTVKNRVCTDCAFHCVGQIGVAPHFGLPARLNENHRYRLNQLAKIDKLATTSRYLQSQVQGLLPQHDIVRVANAFVAREVASNDAKLDAFGVPEILIVGMIGHNKGQLAVVDMIKLLREKIPDFRFVLAGRGAAAETIMQRAKAAGVENFIHFSGFLSADALDQRYQKARVVCIPNAWPEPFGRVPLEAARHRKPVVAYDTGGIGEHILDGKTGLLIKPQDKAAMVDALASMIQDTERARELGEAAHAHVGTLYPARDTAAMLLKFWGIDMPDQSSGSSVTYA